ncbi:MAG: YbhB/YbcL family Raf kinase inhibitor-like protein [Gemmatimonadota bacterium]|nr:YbhB/YbcL family Raf kinase inhibitor-like protein [Gemmatimonadota bacterium]
MGFALSDMQVRSSAFDDRERIPRKHTGEGDDVSPAIEWTSAPDGTRAYAVICHDPDAPLCKPGSYGFVHWVLYNIPGSVKGIPEGGGEEYTTGQTDFGRTGYGGPMPPEGHGPHHYFFWVLALDRELDLPPGLTMEQLLEQVEPHVVGMNRLVGTYERS